MIAILAAGLISALGVAALLFLTGVLLGDGWREAWGVCSAVLRAFVPAAVIVIVIAGAAINLWEAWRS